jgi:hypothetical protein
MRWLTLGKPGMQLSLLSAGYWLQSRDRITDDYAVRIWDDLAPRPQTWVLVTILFDAPVDPGSPQARAFFYALRDSVKVAMEPR